MLKFEALSILVPFNSYGERTFKSRLLKDKTVYQEKET